MKHESPVLNHVMWNQLELWKDLVMKVKKSVLPILLPVIERLLLRLRLLQEVRSPLLFMENR